MALLALLTLTGVLAGCASGGDESAAGGSVDSADLAQPAAAERAAGRADVAAADGVRTRAAGAGRDTLARVRTPAVISTGTLTLRARELAPLRTDVRKVVDAYRGEIAEEETDTGRSGAIVSSRLVLRIPSDDFDAAMQDLEALSRYSSTSRTSEDVTTQVIDVDVRIRAQTASLERMEALLARATRLRDVIAIESQLTRRQADLDSLKAQQAWLADQTSLSTIVVYLERRDADQPTDDGSGFLAGLRAGWHGLLTALTGAATVAGAIIPFAVALTVLGLPLWLVGRLCWRRVARRLAGRRTGRPAPGETAPAPAPGG